MCVLEKLVHVEDPGLLPPDLVMVEYELADSVELGRIDAQDLPANWRQNVALTQSIGDELLRDADEAPAIIVPSAIVSLKNAPDQNLLINHSSRQISKLKLVEVSPFAIDPRLLSF